MTNLRTQYNCHILEVLLHCIRITVYTTVRTLGSLDDRYIPHTAVSSQRISGIGVTDKYTLIIYSTQWIVTILFQISRNYLQVILIQLSSQYVLEFKFFDQITTEIHRRCQRYPQLFRPLETLLRRCLASPLPTPSYLATAKNLPGPITN